MSVSQHLLYEILWLCKCFAVEEAKGLVPSTNREKELSCCLSEWKYFLLRIYIWCFSIDLGFMHKINSIYNEPICLCIFSKDTYVFMLCTSTLLRTLRTFWFNFGIAYLYTAVLPMSRKLCIVHQIQFKSEDIAHHNVDILNKTLSKLFIELLHFL
jgi:hypothetical protein